jgi:NADH-quinone oxidoreductase subunit J
MKTRAGDWVLAAIVGGSLLAVLGRAAFSVDDWQSPASANDAVPLATNPTSTVVGNALIGFRVDAMKDPLAAQQSGLSGYLLPFEIVSIHLLVVLLGAAYLARAKRRHRPRESEG